jgi:hypothetical protein
VTGYLDEGLSPFISIGHRRIEATVEVRGVHLVGRKKGASLGSLKKEEKSVILRLFSLFTIDLVM